MHWRRLSFKHIQILHRSNTVGSGPLYALILDKPASSLATKSLTNTGSDCEDHDTETQDSDKTELITSHSIAGEVDTLPLMAKYSQLPPGTLFTPAEEQDDDLDGQIAQISISHDGEYATAVCLAAEEPQAGDVGGEAAARGM